MRPTARACVCVHVHHASSVADPAWENGEVRLPGAPIVSYAITSFRASNVVPHSRTVTLPTSMPCPGGSAALPHLDFQAEYTEVGCASQVPCVCVCASMRVACLCGCDCACATELREWLSPCLNVPAACEWV